MNVAGTSASQLIVVIGTTVCGQNMASIRTTATAIETSALIRRSRRSRIRAGSSGSTSRSAASGVSGRTSYPAASTAATTSGRPTRVGSTVTVARSVARFTLASRTPSVLFRNRSIRLTHDAQVIPSIGRTMSIGLGLVGVGAVAFILPGSIPRHSRRTADERLFPAQRGAGIPTCSTRRASRLLQPGTPRRGRQAPACESRASTGVPDLALAAPSVQALLPVARDPARRTRRRLVEGMVPGRGQWWAFDLVLRDVVPEPVLARLVALGDRMTGIRRMMARVLGWGRVAAADMTAGRAATKMEPPTARCQALDTTWPARRNERIDRFLGRHRHMVSVIG